MNPNYPAWFYDSWGLIYYALSHAIDIYTSVGTEKWLFCLILAVDINVPLYALASWLIKTHNTPCLRYYFSQHPEVGERFDARYR
jgi:hypothetical protein